MLRRANEILGTYTDHSILAALFVVAAGFAALAVLVDAFGSSGVASAHLMAYGVLSLSLGLTGYALVYLGKVARRLHRELGSAP